MRLNKIITNLVERDVVLDVFGLGIWVGVVPDARPGRERTQKSKQGSSEWNGRITMRCQRSLGHRHWRDSRLRCPSMGIPSCRNLSIEQIGQSDGDIRGRGLVEQVEFNITWGEILVAFDNDEVLRVGDDLTVGDDFNHGECRI